MGLSGVETLGSTEICEVLMVVENDSRERGALDVMAPGTESADDAEELSIIDLIVSFGRGKGLCSLVIRTLL